MPGKISHAIAEELDEFVVCVPGETVPTKASCQVTESLAVICADNTSVNVGHTIDAAEILSRIHRWRSGFWPKRVWRGLVHSYSFISNESRIPTTWKFALIINSKGLCHD